MVTNAPFIGRVEKGVATSIYVRTLAEWNVSHRCPPVQVKTLLPVVEQLRLEAAGSAPAAPTPVPPAPTP